ncbi:unnamed protein product [Callosobruchus maculatus]|uniref:Uncharacterized protein n=1 Tax=Callosobruchus maculatus TaxID=64391 RepID=A0A653BR35_CALMS|nr:unnamed protein product [Callosobruchus maculatus]
MGILFNLELVLHQEVMSYE